MSLHYLFKKIKRNGEYLLNIGIISTSLVTAYNLGLIATIQAHRPEISFEKSDLVVYKKEKTVGQGSFTASKNGTKYYPLGCKGVRRIKEENRVYFSSEKDAKKAGFELSKTC